MNDGQRISIGVFGTAGSFFLDHWEKIPGALAAIATAAFMTFSAVQKWRELRKK